MIHTQREERADDIDFAREISGHTVPYWSTSWPRISQVQRAGLVRVRVISRWLAEVQAIGDAASGVKP